MGDCGEDFEALKQYHKQKKLERQIKNVKHMENSGLAFSTDASGSIHIETDKGKVVFYPSTSKFQHKGKVKYGNAESCERYVRKLFT